MEILPNALSACLETFRPLLRHEVFLTLMTCLRAGEAKCASVFAPTDYQPARTSDFFTTHRVSPQRLMAALVTLVLRCVYSGKLPPHLFWLGDSTLKQAVLLFAAASSVTFIKRRYATRESFPFSPWVETLSLPKSLHELSPRTRVAA